MPDDCRAYLDALQRSRAEVAAMRAAIRAADKLAGAAESACEEGRCICGKLTGLGHFPGCRVAEYDAARATVGEVGDG